MTTRGEEVYRLIGEGHSLASIAWRLDLSVAVVRREVRSLHQELDRAGTEGDADPDAGPDH